MEIANGIIIPVLPVYVLSPDVYYGDDITGISFETEDDQFGRITFENLDSIKICRGENLPYKDNWEQGDERPWIYAIENSMWLQERYMYEKENYGSSYEFGGNVNEMLMDFSHYVFQFHDQFVEAIARGFWFEKDRKNLFKEQLQNDHPFLPLPEKNALKFISHTLTCQVRINEKDMDELISNARFCSQKLFEFALELEGKPSVNNTVLLSNRNGKLISTLRGSFGKQIIEFDKVPTLEDVKPYVEKYIGEVYARRKAIGK